MSEIVSCPQCQRQLRIPDELLGQLVKCPSCGTTFAGVAGTPPAPPTPSPAAFAGEPARSAPLPLVGAYPKPGFDVPPGRDVPFPRRDAAPHRGVLILVLGILSLVFCALTGPVAWILGNTDLAEIRAGRMDPEGEGLTRAGQICGIIGTVLLFIQCGFGVLYVAIISAVVAGAK